MVQFHIHVYSCLYVLSLFPPCALSLIAEVAFSFSFQALSEITFNSAFILNKTERVLSFSAHSKYAWAIDTNNCSTL